MTHIQYVNMCKYGKRKAHAQLTLRRLHSNCNSHRLDKDNPFVLKGTDTTGDRVVSFRRETTITDRKIVPDTVQEIIIP